MPRFRAWPDWNQPSPPWPDDGTVHEYIADAFWEPQFYIDDALRIEFALPAVEEIYWELFQGRALDRSQTRRRERFIAWNAWDRSDESPSDEPLLWKTCPMPVLIGGFNGSLQHRAQSIGWAFEAQGLSRTLV